jgi:ubiquinone/menaquinone biosynthesis C-methylase UbiE
MDGLIDSALSNPWSTLGAILDGPVHPGGKAATEQLLQRADVGSGSRLLDVGCGSGTALKVAQEKGATAIGVDVEPNARNAIRGTTTALPIADDSMDVVLSECVLCLTDLPIALTEADRVLTHGGRLALSDVVVEGELPALPEAVIRALCLEGAYSHDQLLDHVSSAGLEVQSTTEHHEDLLAMRDRVRERVDYEGLLSMMGERGQRALEAIEELEAGVAEGRIGYVSVVARA